MAGAFTDHEKGGIDAEHQLLAKAKTDATSQSAATRTPVPTTTSTVPPAPAPYPLIATDADLKRLSKLVTMCLQETKKANDAIQSIRQGFKKSVQTYLGYLPADLSVKGVRELEQQIARRYRPTAGDIVLYLNFREDVFRDVLFVSTQFGWNPDEVLALWQIEGLGLWIRDTTGTDPAKSTKYQDNWQWMAFEGGMSKHLKDTALARAVARSTLLYQFWGLDLLVPHTTGKTTKDNVLTFTTKITDHDSTFDTGFNNEIGPHLPNVSAQQVREALSAEGIEVDGNHFRLNSKYQATLLALQHAVFKHREKRIENAKSVKNKAGMSASLVPPFPSLIYLYFNSANPDSSVRLMLDLFRGKAAAHSSKELCEVFRSSELPEGVIKAIKNDPDGLLNGHGYMNALRFEFLRQVYELVVRETNVGSPRGCDQL